jgi:hypothetical protein
VPTEVKFTSTAADSALALADWLAIEYADHGRVDWEQSAGMRLSAHQRKVLEPALLRWLHHNFDVRTGLVTWAADPQTTSAGVQSKLRTFSGAARASIAVATIMRDAAALIRQAGWTQQEDDPHGRFDIIGAIAEVSERRGADVMLRVAVIDALRYELMRAGALTRSLTEWNDEPKRRVQDVLHLLSACAGETETI